MSSQRDSANLRFEWRIHGGEGNSLVQGDDSKKVLGDLFAMWLKNKGDVSDWGEAPEFASFIYFHSELCKPVITVWLGLEGGAIQQGPNPTPEPYWEFEGPDGESLTIEREAFDTRPTRYSDGGE